MTVTDHETTKTTKTTKPTTTASPPPRPAHRRRGLVKRRAARATPAARFEPGRIAETRHRNPTWLFAGILLVVLCALGGVLLFSSADDRTEVLVAAGDLEVGEPIEREDLRIERLAIDGDVRSVPPDAASELVGLIPVGRIPAGTLLARGMFADEVPLAAGEMVFGAALDPGEAPLSAVQIGAPVELLAVPKATGPADPAQPSPATGSTVLGRGTVWAVESLASGQLWISMRVPRAVGLAASEASQLDTLRVVLVGGGR